MSEALQFAGVRRIHWEQSWRQMAQYGVFTVALGTLYWVKFLSLHSDLTPYIYAFAWVLLFFVDDWILISDYSTTLDSPPIRWHVFRINVANGLLFVGTVALLCVTAPWYGAILATGWLLVCVGCIYLGWIESLASRLPYLV